MTKNFDVEIDDREQAYSACAACLTRVAHYAELGARHAELRDLRGAHYTFRMMIPHVRAAAASLEDLEQIRARRAEGRA